MEQKKAGNEEIQYEETLSSGRTEFLFAALMLTFALLMNRRAAARGMDLLTGISRGERQTLVLVTHSLQVARRADRVVTLDRGSLVQGATEVAW